MTNAIDTDRPRTRAWSVLAAALAVLLLGLLIASVARADERSDRLDRKLKVMERVLDEVLVQSPNVIVSGSGTTRSLRLDGEGVLLVVNASLIAGRERMRFGEMYVPVPAPAIAPVAPLPPDAPEAERVQVQQLARQKEEEARQAEAAARQEASRKRAQLEEQLQESLRGSREARERTEEAARKNLEGIKRELREALVDYGGTLAELGDDQWLAVALFLGDRGYIGFGDDKQQTVLVTARIGDLRRYAGGDLSRDEALALVTVEER